MKELPAGGREAHVSLLQGLLTRLRVLARRRNGDGHTLRETLEELIEEDEGDEGQDRAEFTEQERELLLNALSFGELQVWDVMVPRSDIQAVGVTAGLGEVVGTMRTAMHTRLPVYRDNLDDVIGMIHIKDLLPYWGDGAEPSSWSRSSGRSCSCRRRCGSWTCSCRCATPACTWRSWSTSTAGPMVWRPSRIWSRRSSARSRTSTTRSCRRRSSRCGDGVLEADARVEVEELEERLGVQLLDAERREDVDTLGGLIFTLLDQVPARGEIVRHPAGIEFEVLEADPRRIKRVRIIRQDQPATAGRGLSLGAATRATASRTLARPSARPARASRRWRSARWPP